MSTAGSARVATEGGDSYKQRVTPRSCFSTWSSSSLSP